MEKSHPIVNIINDEYGIGVVNCEPHVVLWASEYLPSAQDAKDGIAFVNKIRSKYGASPVYPPYGHRAF